MPEHYSKCIECNATTMFLLCKNCKEEWKLKALQLKKQGVGPLSISVRLNKNWKEVVALLNKFELIDPEQWNMTSSGSFSDILD